MLTLYPNDSAGKKLRRAHKRQLVTLGYEATLESAGDLWVALTTNAPGAVYDGLRSW